VKVRAILNPRAGVAARAALEAVQQTGNPWGDLDLKVTGAPGDARRLAREAADAGLDAVLAVGGDGTANEAAWGLLGSPTALGLVPTGSGNGLARALRVPLRPRAALAALQDAVVRRMDVGMANGRPFLNVAGAGFDALVGAAFHEWGKKGGRRGLFSYFRLALPRALTYRAATWTLEAGGGGFEGPAFIVAFVNGREYGGAAVIAPGSRLDDGLLEIVVLEDAPAYELLFNAPRLFVGGIERFRRYRRIAAPEAVLTGPAPFAHHRDGEPEPASDRLEVRVEPRALAVLVPRRTAADPMGPFTTAEGEA
jgi:YegS/Rv2252/BmrU family lipid kinase